MTQDTRFPGKPASEIKTARATNDNSTTRATIITPTANKKVRIVTVNSDFAGSTANGLEVYFGTGANIGTTAGKEIHESHQAAIGPVFIKFDDKAGPIGDTDDVVSIRGTDGVASQIVGCIVTYREED